MIVSRDWLAQYVPLDMTDDALVDSLTMSGLNHEGTEVVGNDQAIDLEVTSNRPDCLGHIGVAREVGILFGVPLTVPDPQPPTGKASAADVCKVEIKSASCSRYTARVIRGVKIGPSPEWMQKRLATIGCESVNNVVDVTNYVMFECGQPLHAFDLKKINGGKIVVRDAKNEEPFVAIDHKTYTLDEKMCVIADAKQSVALAGVMGGAESEITDGTTDVLIEAAWFEPLSVRRTARSLTLQSPSSFRFERNVDAARLDWASRRCCELILEIAGGELLDGVVIAGDEPATPAPLTLRLEKIERVLGISIPLDTVTEILSGLGMVAGKVTASSVTVTPPTWRKDLTREIDLVEEVGRIYGFDKVPDDAAVPMVASIRPESSRVMDKIRNVLTASGADEAMTATLVPSVWADSFSPWTDQPPIVCSQPMLGVLEKSSQNIGTVNLLRRSLVPSLLESRRINEHRFNDVTTQFETARVFLHQPGQHLPDQPMKLAIASGLDYFGLKGVVEAIIGRINPNARVASEHCEMPFFHPDASAMISANGTRLGWIGQVAAPVQKQFSLRSPATVAELDFAALQSLAVLIPIHQNQSPFPPVSRDFNFRRRRCRPLD